MATQFRTTFSTNAHYKDISDNLINYITHYNAKVGKYDVIDNSGSLTFLYNEHNPSPNLNDAMIHDSNYNLIHQNIIYILGTVTAATLFITVLIMGKR